MNDEQMQILKEKYASKDMLAKIVQENLEEFKGMEIEEIKKWFILDPVVDKKKTPIPVEEGMEELTYSIFFKMISPKLDFDHEITCVIELRDKEIPVYLGELPASAGLSLMLLAQAKEEQIHKNIAERCYGLYIYLDASDHLKKKTHVYNVHIKVEDKTVLGNSCCSGIDIYL